MCSVQDTALLKTDWTRVRPRVTQWFGGNRAVYEQYGMIGHNGIDYGVPVGTPVFAPMDGIVKVVDSGKAGYGLHIKIRNPFKRTEVVLGHLSRADVVDGAFVTMGDKIALSGNTGHSTGPHVHEGVRLLKEGGKTPLFEWQVLNYGNGYLGYFDHSEFCINWKGSLKKNTL